MNNKCSQLRGSLCSQCEKHMNPVDRMISPVCLSCAKANHAAIMGKRKKSKWYANGAVS